MWSGFSSDAKGASADIKGLDTSEFEGDEAETYRSKVNEDLPPHLDTTAEAWSIVATALTTFAGKLEDLQTRMTKLQSQADSQSQAVSSAQSAVSSAKSADQAHAASQQAAKDKLKPGETLPTDTYHGQTAGASSSLSNAQQALQDTIDAAATVRSEHADAVDACCRDIDRAKGMRFEKPPGFWGKLAESVGDWIKDHADVLKTISSVLKTISGIAGMLALIPCLAPIMVPIALVTGGAALVIDVGLKLATGEGSWLQIGVDAMSMVPGMRMARVAFAANVGVTGYNVATGKAGIADLVMVVGLGALSMRGHTGGRGETTVERPVVVREEAPVTPRSAAQSAVDRDGQAIIDATRANPVVRRRPGRQVETERTGIRNAPRDADGDFICARTGQKMPAGVDANGDRVRVDPTTFRPDPDGITVPDPAHTDWGHVEDHEWSFTRVQATDEGWTRQQVIDQQQNPDIWQLEANGPNRSAGVDARLDTLLPPGR